MTNILKHLVKSKSVNVRDQLLKPSSITPEWVEVPDTQYCMIDGQGDPNADAFKSCLPPLYSLAYAIKFALKRDGIEHKVQPLEGLWWFEDAREFSADSDRSLWRWTVMVAQPDALTPERFAVVLEEVKRKKKFPELERVRLAWLREGRAAQVMHLGPYADEAPTIARLHAFIDEAGETANPLVQKHHEIYLTDANRTAPARMKTILRQPVLSKAVQ
jgi:hypothetical protein